MTNQNVEQVQRVLDENGQSLGFIAIGMSLDQLQMRNPWKNLLGEFESLAVAEAALKHEGWSLVH